MLLVLVELSCFQVLVLVKEDCQSALKIRYSDFVVFSTSLSVIAQCLEMP